jgi:hypothetical protein
MRLLSWQKSHNFSPFVLISPKGRPRKKWIEETLDSLGAVTRLARDHRFYLLSLFKNK